MKRLIFILLISFFIFFFSLKTFATGEAESKEWIEKILIAMREKWEKEALPIFKTIWKWFKENIWTRVIPLLKGEYEKRKPEVREEFKRKTEEIKREIPQFLEKIWKKLYPSLRIGK